jgi:hypothetical protein
MTKFTLFAVAAVVSVGIASPTVSLAADQSGTVARTAQPRYDARASIDRARMDSVSVRTAFGSVPAGPNDIVTHGLFGYGIGDNSHNITSGN